MKAPLQYLISQEWFQEIKYKAKNKLEVKKKTGHNFRIIKPYPAPTKFYVVFQGR